MNTYKLMKSIKDNDSASLESLRYEILPKEPDEDTNPRIKLYNEIVRRAMTYDTGEFSRCGITDDNELERIYYYVLHDYPEIFWLNGYHYTSTTIQFMYRCVNENGVLDIKQIESKRKELKKHAKFFTKGITKRTKPYDALITIYRRLILALDYDGKGLSAHVDLDESKDDRLRSLYSAIVNHKVVCAGYAAAMQYLLQSVGISCGYVTSNRVGGGGHAFNALKLGKYCYYLDATWGDKSNTVTGNLGKNDIRYDYCCVPLDEFLLTDKSQIPFHTPNTVMYPNLEKFVSTNHEYFRFRKAYLTRYDEDQIVNVFAQTAITYNPKEMGAFTIGFRCYNQKLVQYVVNQLINERNFDRIMQKAKAIVKKKKFTALKYLNKQFAGIEPSNSSTFYVCFK